MKSIKMTAIVIVLSIFFMAGMYISQNSLAGATGTAKAKVCTQRKSNPNLCARLIRFGQVAYDRGQFQEAKHFFQKAITVDPSNVAAWKKYNMAFLALISDKVATDPGFLPDLEPHSGRPSAPQRKPAKTPAADDGC